MLLSLTVKNWLSFRDETTLSLKASRERVRSETLRQLPRKYGSIKILPLAGIYGPNAAGKTALFEAMQLVQELATRGLDPDELTGAAPFLLDAQSAEEPTTLTLEILAEGKPYRYSLTLESERIVEESLEEVLAKSSHLLYRRSDATLNGNLDNDMCRALMSTLPDNQTFLYAAIRLGIDYLRPVHNWFSKSLKLIGLDSSYNGYSQMMVRDDFSEFATEMLKTYAGIDGIGLQEVDDAELRERLKRIATKRSEGADTPFTGICQIVRHGPFGNAYFFVRVTNGAAESVSRMTMLHKCEDGSTMNFDIASESTGTQRLVDLLPAFFDLDSTNDDGAKVYLIDEIDRSFHTTMTHGLIRRFLDTCNHNTDKQLIFNLHDVSLMDSPLFRKDEVWICDKDRDSGCSGLVSVGRHPNTRSDTALLKAYKANAYGGYPDS